MTTTGAIMERMEPILIEFGKGHAEIEKLEIFGSVATGEATAESDLDLLVTFGAGIPQGLDYVGFYLNLKDELERQVGRRIDLINRVGLNHDSFGYNAIRQAVSIYERT